MVPKLTTLPNGLRVLTTFMPGMESATIQIMTASGTREETAETNGIAHFLEHMVFKGTRQFPNAELISATIDGIGADINANTSKERTAYYIKAWQKHLPLAFEILSGFVKDPLLDASEMEREKGVIIEEIAMYEDLPMQKVPYLFEELLYAGTPLAWDTLGTAEIIRGMKIDAFHNFMKDYYFPENMLLTVAGKFDEEEVLKLAQDHFGDIPGRGASKPVPNDPQQINPTGTPQIKLLNRKTEQAHLLIGVRGNPLGHKDRAKETLLAIILAGGMSSRLWLEVRERRGLAYYVRSELEHMKDNGYFGIRAGVRLDQIEEAIKLILAGLNEVKKTEGEGAITQEELNKAKEYIKGKLALGLEDTHSVSEFFADQELFEDKIRTVDQIMADIDLVTVEDLQKLAQEFFQNDRLNMAIIGPFDSSQKFEKLLKL
jgi:predicted Zn-dependent peptidase